MKKLLLIIIQLLILCALCGCTSTKSQTDYNSRSDLSGDMAVSRDIFAMDTYMSIKAYTDDETVLDLCQDKICELENLFSVTHEGSDIWNINHSAGQTIKVNSQTADLINSASDISKLTNGALDISIYPVLEEWGFTNGEYSVPSKERLQQLLQNTGFENILVDGENVTVPENFKIDLGAIAKGYTGDCLIRIFEENNVDSAVISLGGNVQTCGTKPDGSLWNVGIANPFSHDEQIGVISVADKSVITSGNYERYFTDENGNSYWHIIDTETGCPASNGLISVTVIGESGMVCDALSTALFVMGTDKAIELWKNHCNEFDMVLISDDRTIYLTSGIDENFKNTSDFKTYVIEYE